MAKRVGCPELGCHTREGPEREETVKDRKKGNKKGEEEEMEGRGERKEEREE